MNDMLAALAVTSVDGQSIVTRGDTEAHCESECSEFKATTEVSMKRESPKLYSGNTTGEESTVEPKTFGVERGDFCLQTASPYEGKITDVLSKQQGNLATGSPFH